MKNSQISRTENVYLFDPDAATYCSRDASKLYYWNKSRSVQQHGSLKIGFTYTYKHNFTSKIQFLLCCISTEYISVYQLVLNIIMVGHDGSLAGSCSGLYTALPICG